MDFTLEKHRFFPYLAWTIVVGFAVFTYTLTLELYKTPPIYEVQAAYIRE